MALETFYAVLSGTCLALVGLWWSVLDRRPGLLDSPTARAASGGVLLTFLLPGAMGLFAQVAPAQPWVWRVAFVVASAVGIVSTIRLGQRRPAGGGALSGPLRWLATTLYAVVLLVAAAPALVDATGLSGRQAAGLTLVGLVLVGHALAWAALTATTPTNPTNPTSATSATSATSTTMGTPAE